MQKPTKGRAVAAALIAAVVWSLVPATAGKLPKPRAKPVEVASLLGSVPLPRPKPDHDVEETAVKVPIDFAGMATGSWPKAEVAKARSICAQLLSGRKVTWKPEAPFGRPGGCGTAQPIAVSAVAGVTIDPPATLNCPMAAALHDWMTEVVQPAARKHAGRKVTGIVNASSYACRRRNNGRSGKMSEHAFANALDIANFRFGEGKVASVKGDWSGFAQVLGLSGRGNFLRAARKGACDHFNTILGPGSDANHKDHLHLDLMRLRPGRFKMCR
jgi:hypothetical protein